MDAIYTCISYFFTIFFSSIFQNYRVCKSFCFSQYLCVKIYKRFMWRSWLQRKMLILCVLKLVTINSCTLERNNGLLYIVLSIIKHTTILEVFAIPSQNHAYRIIAILNSAQQCSLRNTQSSFQLNKIINILTLPIKESESTVDAFVHYCNSVRRFIAAK